MQKVLKSLGLKEVHDITAGFRAIKVDLLKQLKIDTVKANGYGFLVWQLYACFKLEATIKEVPVVFVDRKFGKTKLGFWDIIEGIIILVKLRFS